MRLRPFELERYFAKYEFSARYLLCASDCQGMPLAELLELADDEMRERWQNLTLGYADTTGTSFLREAIASTYHDVRPDQVLCVVPSEAIYAAMRAMLEPGDHVVCTWPGYQSLYSIAEDMGCVVGRWIPKERRNGWYFDISELEALLRPETKLLVVNFPHNPTGAQPSAVRFRRILEIARERGIRVFSDEMYRRTGGAGEEILPSACETDGDTVTLSGMSKLYGLGGIRIGWLVIKDDELRRKIWSYRDYLSNGHAAPSEVLAAIALRARHHILDRNTLRIAQNFDSFNEFMGEHADRFDWRPPIAGHVALVKLRGDGVSAQAFCDEVVAGCGVMLLPSTVYGFGDRYFRVGFGRADMPRMLDVLGRYLRLNPSAGRNPVVVAERNRQLHLGVVAGIIRICRLLAAAPASLSMSDLTRHGYANMDDLPPDVRDQVRSYVFEFVKDGVVNTSVDQAKAVAAGNHARIWEMVNPYLERFGHAEIVAEEIPAEALVVAP